MTSQEMLANLGGLQDAVSLDSGDLKISDETKVRRNAHLLARQSVLGNPKEQASARYLTRLIASQLGIYPASIHELYMARGRGEVPSTFTVPAMNLRALSFDAARAVFRAAAAIDASAMLFEIARSEIGYTDQRPAEYATNMLAAAISEGYQGPVFIQGDHFQVSAARYADDPESELQTIRDLIKEAITAGFYNIDVDSSTLVDLSKDTIADQQELNAEISASLSEFIRTHEPAGVTISIGGEIGEVGGKNSTEEELRAYTEGFTQKMAERAPGAAGLSKISIQTGTSHGGIVLPDGTLAQVSIDFDTLKTLSQVARDDYNMAGAVQHGASTLPQEAFGKFTESEACEVHLATNFQNMLFERVPVDLLGEMYEYLDANHANEGKPDQTDDQFYYKTRKRAIGQFKPQLWNMDAASKDAICDAWEQQFVMLFDALNIKGTREYVEKHTTPVDVPISPADFAIEATKEEDTSDLAD